MSFTKLTSKSKMRKVLLWVLLVMLIAALVYAADALLSQSNKASSDVLAEGCNTEMATLKVSSTKQDKAKQSGSNINWNQWTKLEKAVEQADNQYKPWAARANAESSTTGKVSDATRNGGMAAAQKFQTACNAFADFQEKSKCITRAKATRQTGKARVAQADALFNPMDSDKISAYNDEMSALSKARKEALADIKADASSSDLASLKQGLAPRLSNMSSRLTALVQQIVGLLDMIRSQAGGGLSVGAVAGCMAKQAASGGVSGVADLLSPVTNLLSLAKAMVSNVSDMSSEISSL